MKTTVGTQFQCILLCVGYIYILKIYMGVYIAVISRLVHRGICHLSYTGTKPIGGGVAQW